MKNILLAILLFCTSAVFAQKKVVPNKNLQLYQYTDDLCTNKGYFDPKKYKKEEIDGVYQLLYKYSGAFFDTKSVFNLNDLDDVRKNKNVYLVKLEQQYKEKKAAIANLKIIDAPIWKNLFNQTIQILDNEYNLDKETLNAFLDPTTLKNSKYYTSCKKYIDAINAPDAPTKYAFWKTYATERSKNNADPAGQMKKFNQKVQSPRKDDYAMIDLIGFGFHNCANGSFRSNPNDDAKLYKSFEKIFEKVKRDCDEP